MPRTPDRFAARLWAAAAIAGSIHAAAAYPPGDSRTTVHANGIALEVFVYKPASYRGEGLIVSLHGLGGNAAGYREYTRPLAERDAALLVVPLFDRDRFPTWRYQRAGIARRDAQQGRIVAEPPERWTGEILRALVERVRAHEGAPEMPYVLLGHSAGGQFLSRMTAFAPLPAARIVIANPSSWVVPSISEPFPYGFGALPAGIGGESALRRYLAQPVTILIGTADTGSKDLSVTPGAMRQGEHRYARAVYVFKLAAATAKANGWDFGWRLIEVPGVAHSARAMYASAPAQQAFCPETASAGSDGARTSTRWPCRR